MTLQPRDTQSLPRRQSIHRLGMRLGQHVAAVAAAAAISFSPLAPAHARILTKAPDIEDGARVFAYVCSACHLGGYNQVKYSRTLQADVLRENGMLAPDAIEYQVINGKNRMPAFENRLTEDEITNAAYYVMAQSQAGWNRDYFGKEGAPNYTKYPSKYVKSTLQAAYTNAAGSNLGVRTKR